MSRMSVPRRFQLFRHAEPSGVVAEGAQWSSGAVALHWPGHPPATSNWAGLEELLAAHGHNGLTEVRWIDELEPPVDRHDYDDN